MPKETQSLLKYPDSFFLVLKLRREDGLCILLQSSERSIIVCDTWKQKMNQGRMILGCRCSKNIYRNDWRNICFDVLVTEEVTGSYFLKKTVDRSIYKLSTIASACLWQPLTYPLKLKVPSKSLFFLSIFFFFSFFLISCLGHGVFSKRRKSNQEPNQEQGCEEHKGKQESLHLSSAFTRDRKTKLH